MLHQEIDSSNTSRPSKLEDNLFGSKGTNSIPITMSNEQFSQLLTEITTGLGSLTQTLVQTDRNVNAIRHFANCSYVKRNEETKDNAIIPSYHVFEEKNQKINPSMSMDHNCDSSIPSKDISKASGSPRTLHGVQSVIDKMSTTDEDDIYLLAKLRDHVFLERHPAEDRAVAVYFRKVFELLPNVLKFRLMIRFLNTCNIMYPNEPTIAFCVNKNLHTDSQLLALSELNSNHAPIMLTLDAHPHTAISRITYNFANADWSKFRRLLNNCMQITHQIQKTEEIETETRKDTTNVQNAKDRTIEEKKTKDELPAEILNMIKNRNRTRRKWQKTRKLEYKNSFHLQRRNVKSAIRKYRKDKLSSESNQLDPNDPK